MDSTRRRLLLFSILTGVPLRILIAAPSAITLRYLLDRPALSAFYRTESQMAVAPDGMAGANRDLARPRLIEEQRNGTEWVIRGVLASRQDWRQLGWRALDLGMRWQQPDGGFGNVGYFHSNSLFLESLARACVVDPAGAIPSRLACLERGCAWLLQPVNITRGMEQSGMFTHRHYILAACHGQAGQILHDQILTTEAARWITAALPLQQADGVNPELNGSDTGYQMVGILFALRYYPTASANIRHRLDAMIRRAIAWELVRILPNGTIATQGSTRVGREVVAGTVKQPNYPEIFQALIYADAIMPNRRWHEAGIAVARHVRLPLPAEAERTKD